MNNDLYCILYKAAPPGAGGIVMQLLVKGAELFEFFKHGSKKSPGGLNTVLAQEHVPPMQ